MAGRAGAAAASPGRLRAPKPRPVTSRAAEAILAKKPDFGRLGIWQFLLVITLVFGVS
jgi:hypothetical protein